MRCGLFFDAFVDSGSSVVICEPTFPMYRYWGEVAGAKIEALRYGPAMEFPLERVSERARMRIHASCSSAIPTIRRVRWLRKEAIETILKAATRTAVVIDEAYVEFSGVTVVPWIEKYPQLFVARTFSKAAGLAGLRLGAVIACPDSLAILRRATAPFPVNVAALAAAEAAVGDPQTMKRYVRDILRTRAWFEKELHKLGVKTYPSAGNFLLADFGPGGPRCVGVCESERNPAARSLQRDRPGLCARQHRNQNGNGALGPTDQALPVKTSMRKTCRTATIHRKTNETDIRIRLNLDGRGTSRVSTGIRFLDHMLDLVARHGAFDLTLEAKGDLDVDQHHTVEDAGIALGEAVVKALGTNAASCAPDIS